MTKIKKGLAVMLIGILGVSTLTSCSSLKKEMQEASTNKVNIKISVTGDTYTKEKEKLVWTELDQMTSFKSLRKVWDTETKTVKFDMGSKNGVMFIDLEGNWAGNNTLHNVFQNKEFVETYWNDSNFKSAVAQAAISEFSDITNEGDGLIASVNTYFNIIPTNSDGTSGLSETISRAEAMSAIYRADTQVVFGEENTEFKQAVGENNYNLYAFGATENSYLDYTNGSLNYDAYNSAITKAEEIYLLMHRYFGDELRNTEAKGALSDCKNAGDIANKIGVKNGYSWQSYELEYCLQNSNKGAPETLYKALVLANRLGIISSETKWNQSITGKELINDIIKVYEAKGKNNGYAVNAKSGANEGSNLLTKAEEEVKEPEKTTSTVQVAEVEKVKDVTKIEDLVEVYGAELSMTDEEISDAKFMAEGFTFEPVDKWMKVDYCYYLNVRVGPSTDFNIIRSVPVGTEVHVVARCVENGWYRIIANGKIVYQCGVYFSELQQ